MAIRSYRELIVWQRAMDLVERIYGATKAFPKEESFGLTSQLRRAAVSIPSNIAEGQGRQTTRDFLRLLRIANGSLFEIETQLLLSGRLQYISPQDLADLMTLCSEIGRMLNALITKLNQRLAREDPLRSPES